MTDADAVDVQRLRNDHEIGASLRDPPLLRQVRDAGKSAALFVDRAADLDRAGQPDAGALERLGGKHRRRNAGFHVADTATVNFTVAHQAAEGIDSPAIAGGHHVDVAIEVDDRARATAPGTDDVDPRVTGRVLGASLGGDVLDLERAPREELADEPRAGLVLLARRVDGRDPHEIGGELHDFVGGAIDFGQDAFDGQHDRFPTISHPQRARRDAVS